METQITFSNEISFLQDVDRILTNKDMLVLEIGRYFANQIGMTNMLNKKIYLNLKKLSTISGDYPTFLKLIKGVNYHELAHQKYSRVQLKDSIEKEYWKIKENLRQIYAIIEDGRIESLFVKRYRNAKDYFRLTTGMLVLGDIKKQEYKTKDLGLSLFMSAYSRRTFLGKEILSKVEGGVTEFKKLTELKKLLDAYNISPDWVDRFEIIKNINDLIQTKVMSPQQDHGRYSTAKEMGAKEEKRELEKDQNEKSSEESKEKSDDNLSNDESLDDAINNEINDAKEATDDDTERQMVIMGQSDFETGEPQLGHGGDIKNKFNSIIETLTPTTTDASISKDIATKLRVIRNGLSSKTEVYQKKGRLHAQSYLKSINNRTMHYFKRQQNNRLAKANIAVNILIDASSSMSTLYDNNKNRMDKSRYNHALRSAWILANSLQTVGAKVKLTEFSDYNRTIKEFHNTTAQVKWDRRQEGNTDVWCSLTDVLGKDSKYVRREGIKNHIVIIITDGEYNNGVYEDKILSALKEKKIKVFEIGIESEINNCEFNHTTIKSVKDLVGVMDNILVNVQNDLIKQVIA